MKSLILLCFAIAFCDGAPSYPHALHPGVGAIYKGPNSETIIKGPDGSIITSQQEGGEVAIKGEAPIVGPGGGIGGFSPIVVGPSPDFVASVPFHGPGLGAIAPFAPVISEQFLTASVGPIISEPIITASVPPVVLPLGPAVLDSVIRPIPPLLATNPIVVPDVAVVAKDPKIVEEHIVVGDKIITVPKKLEENVDLVGPSGTISTRGGDVVVAGPSSTTIKGGGVVASIDKQDDINIKTVEVKSVVAPAIIQAPKIIAPAPVIASEAAVQTIITANPILGKIPDARVAGGIIHPPVIHSHAPTLVHSGPLLQPNFVDPSLTVIPDFYAPVLGGLPFKPIIHGPFH
ncbi:PREDICTED: uncharacterized protein LOC108560633 [Nicrophorus vespilloides]|uniref:Uncharacterized protein LOC108560633 n=1 Tax=Nicrophorus vespilloides TaxID=110193 RepID=A0ABM1MGQ4_NICVS|nr:PREDICTED: uncharacterized protein LOC108560633 [Nicrophorus vespilloides]